nr:putative RNA-directed DNA polymerase [Tanacetum cinerariifolium]
LQLDNDCLKQIDADDLEEMELKWKGHFARECRSPKDTRRNIAAKPQRRNVPVETSTLNALVSQCDGVGSYDWSFQAEEEPTNYALMAFTSLSSSRLESVEARLLVYQQNEIVFEEDIKLLKLEVQLRDNALVVLRQKFEKAEQERDDLKLKLEKFQTSSKNLSQLLASQTNDKTGLGYNTQVFTSSMFDCDEMFTSESDESWPSSLIYDRYQSGDRYHAVSLPYTGTFMPPKLDLVFHNAPNVNETVHTAFNVELSPTKPDNDLSHTHRPSAPIIEDWVSDSEDDSEAEIPQNAPTATHKTTIPKPKSQGNSKNRKACFVCKSLTYLIKDCDYYAKKMAQTPARNLTQRGNHQQYARLTLLNPQRHVVPTAVLTKSKLVPIPATRPVTTATPKPHVTRQRQAKIIVTKPHSPPRRHINRSPSPKASNFPPKVTTAKAPMVNVVKGVQGKWEWKPKCPILDHGNPQHALKDKGVIDSGCSRHITGNMSYFSDFEEINGGYVAFGGNPKSGKISGKGIENQLSLKVKIIRSDNGTEFKNNDLNHFYGMKGVKRKFSVPKTPQQNGIAKRKNGTLIEVARAMLADSLLSIPFWADAVNTACYVQNRVLVTKPQNKTLCELLLGRTPSIDAAFEVKEPEFEGRKPQSEVHVSPSSSAQTKKHDDKTNREAKGKSPVNAADSTVHAVRQISTNSTNTFSADGPSNTAVCLTHRKSSYVDASQYPDDPNMPELEDVTYFDDEEDVDAEADFTNLETTITVSLIPTTRVHKDHSVTQIIGDLSLATQTRSMTRVAKDQGGLTQKNNDDFHTCMFACFLSQEEPKRVHQALKDLSWIEAMQEELLQFKMQKEDGIDYEEVFAPVARIEAIRLFLAYASFMGFMVYQMNVKSAFLYETIEEDVYVCQPPGFKDPDYPDKVYKVVKALYGLHQSPRACQDKYVAEILRKFSLTDGKSASTPIDTEKPLLKDPNGEDVDVHTYRSMIGSLMYLTSSRPDIMFAVYACACF